MSRSVKTRWRRVALAVGASALGSLAFASASFAGVPGGVGCNPVDGKISGRGATFQTPAQQQVFIPGFESDVCGNVALQYPGDPAGNTMIAYNYNVTTTTPKHVALTGSGQGLQAAACRTDAFGGTDIPYNQARLQTLWGASGVWNFDGFTNCDPVQQNANAVPPYTPGPNAASPFYPSTVGGTTNDTANLLSFPVAGGAAAIGVHFNAGDPAVCSATKTLTTAQMSAIFSGAVSNWNSIYPGCNIAITRVVRSDVSGTTQGVKNYFAKADGAGGACGGQNWAFYQQLDNNTSWPTGGTCAGNLSPQNGTGACTATGTGVLGKTCNTDGAIGYGDLRAWSALTAGTFLASLQTAASAGGPPAFVGPGTVGGLSNCNITGVASLPGTGSPSDFLGLNSADGGITPDVGNWGVDANPTVSNIAYIGNKWPICTLTYDLVYAGLSASGPNGPIGGLTDDQRRTLYSYLLYVESPAGQAGLSSKGYDPLPASWLSIFRSGFAGTTGAY